MGSEWSESLLILKSILGVGMIGVIGIEKCNAICMSQIGQCIAHPYRLTVQLFLLWMIFSHFKSLSMFTYLLLIRT